MIEIEDCTQVGSAAREAFEASMQTANAREERHKAMLEYRMLARQEAIDAAIDRFTVWATQHPIRPYGQPYSAIWWAQVLAALLVVGVLAALLAEMAVSWWAWHQMPAHAEAVETLPGFGDAQVWFVKGAR